MGIKITAVALLVLALGLVGFTAIPDIVTGILLIIGSIGILAGY